MPDLSPPHEIPGVLRPISRAAEAPEAAPAEPEPAPPTAARPVPVEPRPGYAEPGPNERVYAVAFGRVWLAALGAVNAMGRWTITATDPVRGEILVEARALLRKAVRPVRVTIVLDELGLTRVDATYLHETGGRAEGVEPGQIARFHRQLETLLRRDSRA